MSGVTDAVTASNNGASIVPVLAGGGARLPAHIGILRALQELSIDDQELVGVSGGSIVAALRAAGYSLPKIKEIAAETDFSQFLGQNLLSLVRTGGLSSGDWFETWMDAKMQGRRFGDLAKPLHVVATDIRAGQPIVFSTRQTPDVSVARAVRFSMSVPLLFSFKHHGEAIMADGSILSEEALRRDWSGTGTPVVVFKLRGRGALKGGHGVDRRKSLLPLRDYMAMLIHAFMTTLAHEHINEDFWLSTIVVDTGDVSPLAFALGPELKEQLYEAGLRDTLEFLPLKMARDRAKQGSR